MPSNHAPEAAITAALNRLDARSVVFRVAAHGARWEPLQALRPEGPPLHPSDFDVVAVHDLGRDRMRIAWRRAILEPLTDTVVYDEIVVENGGYITGADVALHPRPARPMPSDRLAAVRRQQFLLHPHLLVGDARRRIASGEAAMRVLEPCMLDGKEHAVVEIDAVPRPIRIFVDLASGRPSRLVTQENDYPRGDVEIEVMFADWRDHGTLSFPYEVELRWDGVVLHRERRDAVDVNPQLGADTFVLPASAPYDAQLAYRGLIHAQWIHRALAMGAPIFLDAGQVFPTAITPDVVTMGGPVHHSMAIALAAGIVVVDPPQNEERSLAVIQAVRERWPDKPITHLVLTHHHHDHSGGIRAYAAIGAELVVAEGDRRFVQECLERPHTIQPDTFAAANVRPEIRAVGDRGLSLGGGAIEVRRISSPHSAENLVVYVAGPKLLFNADLFNPGLVPPGVAPPPHWLTFSRDYRKQVEALGLNIEILLGAHGALEGRPYQSLIDFTE